MSITNKSPGPRIVIVKDMNGFDMHHTLMPGDSTDFELVDSNNIVYRAWQESGDVDFGGALTDPAEAKRGPGRPRLTLNDKPIEKTEAP